MTTTDMQVLDSLSNADREVAVTAMLNQARQWLEKAKDSTAPAQDVSQFKAFVATVVEAAKQKKLSEEIQLDAVEMLRRSERALGVAIRQGQTAGEIARPGDIGGVAPGASSRSGGDLARAAQFAPKDELTADYAMADQATDEEFDAVIAAAKEEGNLSRANVVRKVAELGTYREQQDEKWQTVADLAERRLSSPQIARQVGMTEESLRAGAKRKGITFPADEAMGRTKRIRPLDVLDRIILGLEVSATSLELVSFEDVTPEQAAEWLDRLAGPLRALKEMQTTLKGIK